MAKRDYVALLKQGVEPWNAWRQQYPDLLPDLSFADLSDADLSFADLYGAKLSAADLSGAKLSAADLSGANLSAADLSGANLYRAKLSAADLSGANLDGADLSGANLSGAKLRYAGLSGADLSDADLRGANLDGADLSGAKLSAADLRGANLSGADLRGADLRAADLRAANLYGADLSGADLSGADLSGADLSAARLFATVLAHIDLCNVKGLIEVVHEGPSDVVLHTVQLPQDGSALHFLRGVGVPDEWIDFYRMHVMSPIQYYSCFISYSSKDDVLARRLHADLQAHGVRCWFAPEDMRIGDKIRARINEAIHLQDKLLLLLSEHAVASSWVEDEVETAFEKEQRQQREVLFPVRLDEQVMQVMQPWAVKLRRRHIGDFTHWTDPQAYQRAFERLLRDLRAQASKPKV